jgi:hypothetical protein
MACNAGLMNSSICVDGSTCVITSTQTGAGTCKARALVGEACNDNGVQKPVCEDNLLCFNDVCVAPDPATCHG